MPLNNNAINQILPWADEGLEADGDLLSLEEYAADVMRIRGFRAGLARRALFNRVHRQTAHMAAGLAQYIANRYTKGVLDDANLDAVEAGLQAALEAGFLKLSSLGGTPSTQAFGDAASVGVATSIARSDHKHAMPAVPTSVSGNAGTATKLTTARTVQTNLASAAAASFDGSANITPGVTGTLPIANGGTGNTAGLAATATALATGRTIQTNLASTATASFNGSANVTPGVTGTLPVANGGTGNTSGSAVSLTTARTIQTNLASTATASFNGTANVTPGVTGTLPIGNGGTGNTAGLAATATALATARTIQTNLASTATASFNGSANVTPGVTGTLPIANGGTGLTAAPSLLTNLATTTAASPLAASPRPGVTGTLPIGNGGTGATTAAAALTAIGAAATTDSRLLFGAPDTARVTSLSAPTATSKYTVPYDGFICVELSIGGAAATESALFVDGHAYARSAGAIATQYAFRWLIPVYKGQSVWTVGTCSVFQIFKRVGAA